MKAQISPQRSSYEKSIQSIMRRLPTERLAYLVEFARFLEFEIKISQASDEVAKEETVLSNHSKWDELLATSESKALLQKMAREARAAYLANETSEIQLTDDDHLAPV